MTRLPTPGQDTGQWGTILNDFLSQTHTSTGTLRPGVVSSTNIQDNTITTTNIKDGAITTDKIADSTIISTKLDNPTQAAITAATTAIQPGDSPTTIGAAPAITDHNPSTTPAAKALTVDNNGTLRVGDGTTQGGLVAGGAAFVARAGDTGTMDLSGAEVTLPAAARLSSTRLATTGLDLSSWAHALLNVATTPVRVVVAGGSTTQGSGASTLDLRNVDLLGDRLHALYNPTGVAGGKYRAIYDSGWATTGTAMDILEGLGWTSNVLSVGATKSRTVTCTSVTVLFAQGPGQEPFTVTVGSEDPITVTPDTTGSVVRYDGLWSSEV